MILKDDPKAYAIMGCAMRVHSIFGYGFLESAYGDALEIEFKNAGIPHVREDNVRIYYDGQPLPTNWRADFTCFDRSYIVELKAIKSITKIEWAQVIHYMRATRIPYALLLNFGRPQLQYDTFDLAKLPSGSVIETAAAPQIKGSQSLSVNCESKTRSTDYSAEREPHGSEFFTSKPGSQPKVRSGPEDGCVALKSADHDNGNDKPPQFLQLMETTIHPVGTKPHDQRTPTTVKPDFTCVYFQNVRLLLAGAERLQTNGFSGCSGSALL